jgi:hypothetical protein
MCSSEHNVYPQTVSEVAINKTQLSVLIEDKADIIIISSNLTCSRNDITETFLIGHSLIHTCTYHTDHTILCTCILNHHLYKLKVRSNGFYSVTCCHLHKPELDVHLDKLKYINITVEEGVVFLLLYL